MVLGIEVIISYEVNNTANKLMLGIHQLFCDCIVDYEYIWNMSSGRTGSPSNIISLDSFDRVNCIDCILTIAPIIAVQSNPLDSEVFNISIHVIDGKLSTSIWYMSSSSLPFFSTSYPYFVHLSLCYLCLPLSVPPILPFFLPSLPSFLPLSIPDSLLSLQNTWLRL